MRHRERTAVLFPAVLVAAALLLTGCTPQAAEGVEPSTQDSSAAKRDEVEVATDLQFSGDDSVSWLDAKLATSAIGEPNVVPVRNATRRTARVAAGAELLTPEGCVPPFGEIKVDDDGLGKTSCTWDTFVGTAHFAPKIWLDEDGRVSRIASRYHP